MSTLVLAANTGSPISLVVQTAGEGAPVEVGSVTQSFNGVDRSSVRGVKRGYASLTTYLDTATKDSVINLLKWGNQIPCSGDLLANIQTQCTVRYTGCRMVQAVGLWEVGLTLSEVQPSVTLLRYSPGDTITGESFSRSTTATYRDGNGNVATAAINVKRDNHQVSLVKSLLLEDARQNIAIRSEELDNAAWSKIATTVAANGGAAPSGTATADKIQEDSTNASHAVTQVVTCASAIQTFSIWVTSAERTKCVISMSDNTTGNASIGVDLSNGSTFASGLSVGSWTGISARVESWGAGWYRVLLTATRGAGTQTLLQVFTWTTALTYAGTTGSGLYAWGAQLEMAAFGSSYIPTTTVAVTRAADSYSLPFTTPPQEMTVYAKFVEEGTASIPNARLWEITNAAEGAPLIRVYYSGAYFIWHQPGTAAASFVASTPAIGDTNELAARLYGDGSVDMVQSVNGGASNTGAQSAMDALATAWVAQLLWLNSAGTVAGTTGFTAIQSFKIIAGARSLAELRAA